MKKLTALLLALALCLALAACGSSQTGSAASQDDSAGAGASTSSAGNAPDASQPDESGETATDFAGTDINMAVLSGPTGIGAVKLMERNDNGETVNHYNFTVATDNSAVVAGLANGDYDIAAVATNVAANLYNQTSGGVQICALNTYGVLYILENGDTIQSMADLAGKTIYATGQGANPEYVLNYLLTQNGLTPGEDVTVEYMDSNLLMTEMAAGTYEVCMLPVPAVTSVLMQNSDVRTALDLTEEWNKVTDEGVLTMGCVVVRTEFAQENPEAVKAFLSEYADSISYVQENVEEASQLCETYGIVAKAAVAAAAIPDCNLCCVTGGDIQSAIEPYYNVLFEANPDSIGGALPVEDFYFVAS